MEPSEAERAVEAGSSTASALGELTGTALADESPEHICREEFAYGGMSSGMISLETWRRQLVPTLVQRATTLIDGGQGRA
jgi:hypothetical protein